MVIKLKEHVVVGKELGDLVFDSIGSRDEITKAIERIIEGPEYATKVVIRKINEEEKGKSGYAGDKRDYFFIYYDRV